jgi:hypothetical protein
MKTVPSPPIAAPPSDPPMSTDHATRTDPVVFCGPRSGATPCRAALKPLPWRQSGGKMAGCAPQSAPQPVGVGVGVLDDDAVAVPVPLPVAVPVPDAVAVPLGVGEPDAAGDADGLASADSVVVGVCETDGVAVALSGGTSA